MCLLIESMRDMVSISNRVALEALFETTQQLFARCRSICNLVDDAEQHENFTFNCCNRTTDSVQVADRHESVAILESEYWYCYAEIALGYDKQGLLSRKLFNLSKKKSG